MAEKSSRWAGRQIEIDKTEIVKTEVGSVLHMTEKDANKTRRDKTRQKVFNEPERS